MDSEDVNMKILIATDCHLGFMEKDPVRGSDSLETFKEILSIAKSQDVDFILLGGDLFHENKPSHHVMFRTMELFRQYCVGSRPCPIEFRSDPSINFKSSFPTVNYEDPNYNISIPVFSIHGNHDDPTGEHNLSSIDILSVANLINYFGKSPDVENISLSPVLLQKGETKLALYGLGSIRDERLNRTFRHGKVKFLRPKEELSKWFSLLVLHQNRSRHSASNFIPATFLPSFFDLVVWGHEHETHTSPEYQALADVGNLLGEEEEEEDDSGRSGFYIYQPGSSVATSLSEGEVAQKHIGILQIKGTDFCVNTFPLKTVRPFVMDTVSLSKTNIDPLENEAILSYLTEKVKSLIGKARSENPDSDKIPIVRLKVDYSNGYSILSQARFCQYFVDKVANPKSVLQWYRRKQQSSLGHDSNNFEGLEVVDGRADDEEGEHNTISSLLKETLVRDRLVLLSEKNLVEAVDDFVVKNEKEAISDFVKYSLQQTQDFLISEGFPEDNVTEQLEKNRDEIMKRQEQSTAEHMTTMRTARPQTSNRFSDESDNERHDSEEESSVPTTRGRGRGRGRGTTSTRSRGRGKKSQRDTASSSAAATPRLSLSSTGATRTQTKRTTSSKRTSKQAVIYEDDDSDISLNPKKRSKSDKVTVDLTQESNEDSSDDDPFEFKPSKRK